ncbi:MAG: BolA family protein [Acidiferrobacteraceae bacterium]|jgi:BolA protein
MSDRVHAIETRLRQTLRPEAMEVHDESAAHAGHAGAASGGGHFAVTIVAAAFSGQDAVARHRMIYEALADMRQEIHALSIRALAPDEL